MKQSVNIILSGGGTGGHIYPAISIANELKLTSPKARFLFVGAKNKMEMEKVPLAGYEIKGLWISGIQRKLSLTNLAFPFKLLNSLWNAFKIIKKFRPDIVIGTGGYASGPLLFVASLKGIITMIQEQNSFPGITNKLLAGKAHKICVAYDGLDKYFSPEKLIKTGNPVRQDLLEIEEKRTKALTYFNLKEGKKTLVIIGGSLGARAINNLIEKHVDWLLENDVQLIWQTGTLYFEEFKKHNTLEGVQTHAYLDKMDLVYAVADIIISRSGASLISELCIVGKPVIFIPSPNVSEDHQTKNALAIVNQDAAILLKESELSIFENLFSELLLNKELQNTLGKNIKKLALPNATKDIVKEIESLLC